MNGANEKRWPKILSGASILVVAAGIAALRWLHPPFPQYEGEKILPGLKEPVEIFFDDYAVPHVYASSEFDLFYAAGFVAARERLFQMTTTAAATEGRLAELFGPEALKDDIYLRTWGIPKVARAMADQMSAEGRAIAEAFCAGIAACIDEMKNDLPIEFKLLGIDPIPWEPHHVTGFVRLMGHNLTFSWRPEIVLGLVASILGPEMAAELMPAYPPDAPVTVAESGVDYATLYTWMSERDGSVRSLIGMEGAHLGSNNWVVSGTRTESGKPILANDPHLPFTQPPRWYEMHLVGGRFDVSGACLAGVPLPVLGQNRSCAWGFTNLMIDDLDFFVETVDSTDANRYQYDGEWKAMEAREEVLRVKGGRDTTVTIRETVHGPVITDIHPLLKSGREVVAMKWGGHEVTDELTAIMKLSLMSNWKEFNEAALTFKTPGQNVVYADTAGNIGWRPFTGIPVRKGGALLVPVRGESSEWDWKGQVPFEMLPTLFNPPAGFIATANHKMIANSFPYYTSLFWEDPARIERITEVLAADSSVTVEEMKALQTDVLSTFSRVLAPRFVAAFDRASSNDAFTSRAVDLLREWDGRQDVESGASLLFNTTHIRLLHNLYGDELARCSEGALNAWLAFPPISYLHIRNVVSSGSSLWADNVATEGVVETVDDLLSQSLVEAAEELRETHGNNPERWRWGKVHTLTHPHSIGRVSKALDFLFGFNVGPFPIGGSSTTVNNGEFSLNRPYAHVNGPSFRRIVDFADLDATQFVLPTGQSGLPRSPHYDDQAKMFVKGVYRTTRFSRESIESAGWRKLVLVPRASS